MSIHHLSQLELNLGRVMEKDRNFHLGGRSFYFFDFDDNIALLGTPCILFHKVTGEELLVSSGDWAKIQKEIGKSGFYRDYEISYDDEFGSFRNFRDIPQNELLKRGRIHQSFVDDIQAALLNPDWSWKGPSWNCFYHATFNRRPISIITARGHSENTVKDGISYIKDAGFLPELPNFLSIFAVNNPQVRCYLGDPEKKLSVAKMKQLAIIASVDAAFSEYGYNPHHRFGISDDDPENIQMLWEELVRLKNKYPENSFFIIETSQENFIKHEVKLNGTCSSKGEMELDSNQLTLFLENVPHYYP